MNFRLADVACTLLCAFVKDRTYYLASVQEQAFPVLQLPSDF